MVIVGCSKVGKTAIINKFLSGQSPMQIPYVQTTAEILHQFSGEIDGKQTYLSIYDTPNLEDHLSNMVENHLEGEGLMLVYSICDSESLEYIKVFLDKAQRKRKIKNLPLIVIGNKTDLTDNRQVSTEEGKLAAGEFPFLETSCFNDASISDAFSLLYGRLRGYKKDREPGPLRSSVNMTQVEPEFDSITNDIVEPRKSRQEKQKSSKKLKEEPPMQMQEITKNVITDYSNEYELFVIGGGGVGKSCITTRFITNTFNTEYDPTIEESFQKNIILAGEACFLHITDTAGQEEYFAAQNYIPAQGFLLIYDITEKRSFEELDSFIKRIQRSHEGKPIPIVLIGNKCDLEANRRVSKELGEQKASSIGAYFFESSARSNINISESFNALVAKILSNRKRGIS